MRERPRPGTIRRGPFSDETPHPACRFFFVDSDYHEDLLQTRFLEHSLPIFQPPPQALEGQVFAAYRLSSQIGQGGMGSVWRAERCDGRFEGRAAVKLLNVALLGHAGEERFRREGRFLAKLTHPHIARLLDAGVSGTGQPYLVLEHVNGQQIDHYCDQHALALDARIRLFLDVLEAVSHAHANPDRAPHIKPANVLVTVDGQVKLLDFGIAKLMDGDAPWGQAADSRALTQEAGAVRLMNRAVRYCNVSGRALIGSWRRKRRKSSASAATEA